MTLQIAMQTQIPHASDVFVYLHINELVNGCICICYTYANVDIYIYANGCTGVCTNGYLVFVCLD